MCGICGCSDLSNSTNTFTLIKSARFSPLLQHHHAEKSETTRLIQIEQDLLNKNNAFAQKNRTFFQEKNIFTLNLVSSPGSGKTTLLVETIKILKDKFPIFVIEGDQQTQHDADRIRATGIPAIQINTGRACHLEAQGIENALLELTLEPNSLLAIENVGNLVCPASFDLGEARKVVVLSVTEGEDKPLKYPDMFRFADLMILNKIDLLPYVDFDVNRCLNFAKQVNPDIEIFQLSATKGDNFSQWTNWLTSKVSHTH